MAIRILTDSTSDIQSQEAREKGLMLVPLRVNFADQGYRDGVDITHEEFYEKLAKAEQLPTTSQPTPEDFLACFEQVKAAGDTVICILLSGGLSGTAQSAQIAKDLCDYENIYVIDSRQVTGGLCCLVDLALELVKQGKSAREIVAEVEKARDRVKMFIMVDTLEYLHKGGRLSGAVNVVGTMLKVKPLIALPDGKLEMVGKGMGAKDAFRSILKLAGDELNNDPRLPVYFVYTAKENNCQQLMAQAQEKYGLERMVSHSVGAVLGTHVGPGAAAMAYLAAE